MEIRHIPGKINLEDTITRHMRADDAEYIGQVKRLDQELVDVVKISINAIDEDVQRRLDQLCSKQKLKKKSNVQQKF